MEHLWKSAIKKKKTVLQDNFKIVYMTWISSLLAADPLSDELYGQGNKSFCKALIQLLNKNNECLYSTVM